MGMKFMGAEVAGGHLFHAISRLPSGCGFRSEQCVQEFMAERQAELALSGRGQATMHGR